MEIQRVLVRTIIHKIDSAAAMGVDVSQLYAIQEALLSTSPALFLLAGFERLLTMINHLAMSTLVCYGVAHRKTGVCLLLCLVMHTVLDLSTGISLVLPQNTAYLLIYAILTVMAVLSLLILRRLHSLWQKGAPCP